MISDRAGHMRGADATRSVPPEGSHAASHRATSLGERGETHGATLKADIAAIGMRRPKREYAALEGACQCVRSHPKMEDGGNPHQIRAVVPKGQQLVVFQRRATRFRRSLSTALIHILFLHLRPSIHYCTQKSQTVEMHFIRPHHPRLRPHAR